MQDSRSVPGIPRTFGYVAAALALVLGALVATGAALEDRTRERIAGRIGESLQADAAIERGSLALVRGRLDLVGLAVHRDDAVGHLAITVDDLRCELPPLGLALVDRSCGELAVRGVRLEVSTAAVFQIHNPKRKPIHADRVVIDDAVFVFAPSAMVSSLGRIAIFIDHAEAGPTVFKTPLSWLFSLQVLRARLELPAGATVQLRFDRGVLSAAGTLFGSSPASVHVTLPAPHGDARDEIRQLADLGIDFAEQLVTKRAEDWIRSKL
jgi:hypothetical protein